MTAKHLEQKLGRLLILETTRLENPDMLTKSDWKEYRSLRNQYESIYHTHRQRRRINYQQLRKYLEGGAI